MPPIQRSFTCLQCRLRVVRNPQRISFHSSSRLQEAPRSSVAPKATIDGKHIRLNPLLHEENSIKRNYKDQSRNPERIISLLKEWKAENVSANALRRENNQVIGILGNRTIPSDDDSETTSILKSSSKEQLLSKAKELKSKISAIEQKESTLMSEIRSLELALPNITSNETPDKDAAVRYYISEHPTSDLANSERIWRSHVHIGAELDLLDFEGAATTSGWGWYFLTNEAADLEQALVQYALSMARKRGWKTVSPPSMVYNHIGSACGFQPRDQNGETQIYNIQQSESDIGRRPGLSLAGTAEIPLAGMKANKTLEEKDMPMKRVGVSRSYRAEAGARGVDTKGLYRVHEFTKVEMFAWTKPDAAASCEVFDEMLQIQTEILANLGLHCRVLEMPATDLGASASRKNDIEAYFPSRSKIDNGWGEVTSVSTCTDYQTRRLATRLNLSSQGGKLVFPYTVNGTAMAVPRVLAAILENGWDEEKCEVKIPKVLWPWMDGKKVISKNAI